MPLLLLNLFSLPSSPTLCPLPSCLSPSPFSFSPMEVNALTRWESIGKDLYAKGQLGHEIERIKEFSQMLSAARKRHRQSTSPLKDAEGEEKSPKPTFTVQLAPADGGPPIPLGGIIEDDAERDRTDGSLDEDEGGHRAFSATSSLPLLYPLSALKDAKEEERIQDDLEKKELDEIPIIHARVSTRTPHPLPLCPPALGSLPPPLCLVGSFCSSSIGPPVVS